MRAARRRRRRTTGKRAHATSGAWERRAGRIGGRRSVSGGPASARYQGLYLMRVAKKLPVRLTALHRAVRLRPRRSSSRPAVKGDPMGSYKVVLSPSAQWTRVLVSQGPDELLRAVLPAASLVRHERAAPTLLEGLALWLDTTLSVVLSVDAREAASCLGLTDALGIGARSVYYQVDVSERGRRRRGTRIRGMGDFGDLRQLRLVTDRGE